jgi:hypothetical protein
VRSMTRRESRKRIKGLRGRTQTLEITKSCEKISMVLSMRYPVVGGRATVVCFSRHVCVAATFCMRILRKRSKMIVMWLYLIVINVL